MVQAMHLGALATMQPLKHGTTRMTVQTKTAAPQMPLMVHPKLQLAAGETQQMVMRVKLLMKPNNAAGAAAATRA
jgi:hypothetical protein